MIQNHFNALDFVYEAADSNRKITEEDIRHLHYLLAEHLVEKPGEYRQVVRLGSTPPGEIKERMGRMIEFMNNSSKTALIIAASVQYGFVRVCPFSDFNEMLARLLTNLVLLRSGHPIVVFQEHEREKYRKALCEKKDLLRFIMERLQYTYFIYFSKVREHERWKKLQASHELRKQNYRQLDEQLEQRAKENVGTK